MGRDLDGRAVTVLGAGIAGLAVARALALRGAEVTVLEQASEIGEVGAGIQVSPNGAVVLGALGLSAPLEAMAMRAEAVELHDGPRGRRVVRMALSGLRPTEAYRFVHRADLIAMLAEGARDAGVQMRFLQKADEVRLGEDGPEVVTAQGARLACPLLIGADGLHSRTRATLNGAVAPFFTHHCAWRALIPAEPGARPVAEVHMGPGCHLVSYPLRGGTLRNIVAVQERRAWVEESWTLADDPAVLRAAFAGFSPRVRGWLDQVGSVNLWGLFRHPVAPVWQRAGQGGAGPWAVAILGDAAHPTLPFLAQGASMGLEDAWTLAAALAEGLAGGTAGGAHGDLEAALARWQRARAPRCARIVEAASRNARAYHLTGPARAVAHLGLGLAGRVAPGRLLGRFDWIYGHDVTAGAPG
ncbi:FAD-dependent monooxygenase [Frigidibacter sp. MR17.24]|uniref:FAD-dependent monooxygenase n=1 Tax=Frigidibacter sp. MR17.24 TaxID=3127345 RepID=UPI003012D2D4